MNMQQDLGDKMAGKERRMSTQGGERNHAFLMSQILILTNATTKGDRTKNDNNADDTYHSSSCRLEIRFLDGLRFL